MGAARAAGLEKGELIELSRSSNDFDKVREILPESDTQKYKETYEKWKLVLEQKMLNNDTYRR